MIIVYRVAWFTYLFARLMIKIPYIGLVNVVAGKHVVPELIQHEFTPLNVANKAVALLNDPEEIATIRRELKIVREKLGDKGASLRAAQSIMKMINPAPNK
jgi:lipid-A-disaccharide synthase